MNLWFKHLHKFEPHFLFLWNINYWPYRQHLLQPVASLSSPRLSGLVSVGCPSLSKSVGICYWKKKRARPFSSLFYPPLPYTRSVFSSGFLQTPISASFQSSFRGWMVFALDSIILKWGNYIKERENTHWVTQWLVKLYMYLESLQRGQWCLHRRT